MIKHRFILRDVSDFKVFAAIPVESSLLTWKRWVRPPDWEAFRVLCLEAADATKNAEAAFRTFAEHATALQKFSKDHTNSRTSTAGVLALNERMASHVVWACKAADRVVTSWNELTRVASVLPPPEEQTADLFSRAIVALAESLGADVDPEGTLPNLRTTYARHINVLDRSERDQDPSWHHLFYELKQGFRGMVVQCEVVEQVVAKRLAFVDRLKELASSDPLTTTACPPGLPFAVYTVEFDGTVVNVVEGCAWLAEVRATQAQVDAAKEKITRVLDGVSSDEARAAFKKVETLLATAPMKPQREPTDEEKCVVEIVSQMLCERSLNPKADTKIPVREVDPKHAHQTREAERRDVVKSTASVRTIKFEVTPPRYLREAAEHILSNPRRAHWVIGHWRNQPYGEKHALRRQSWIKPHIRGLGEASATTARVVAPHAVTT